MLNETEIKLLNSLVEDAVLKKYFSTVKFDFVNQLQSAECKILFLPAVLPSVK